MLSFNGLSIMSWSNLSNLYSDVFIGSSDKRRLLYNCLEMMTNVRIIVRSGRSYASQISNLLNSNCKSVIKFIVQATARRNVFACYFWVSAFSIKITRFLAIGFIAWSTPLSTKYKNEIPKKTNYYYYYCELSSKWSY